MRVLRNRITISLVLFLLLFSLFSGLVPNQNIRAVIINPGIYFSVGYTNYTVNVPINFSQIIINTTNITFNHCNFRFRQIPSISKINISFVSLIANPLVAVSGNKIVDYYRYTAAIPITMWHNITGLKPSYVYRYMIDITPPILFVTSNVSGGIAFSTTATGAHRYTIYDYGAVADITPPTITINYAGHLNDKGSPYFRPPGETNILHANGYYINDSYQYEKFIYINCTVTDASAIAGVTLRWWNVTANTWSNVTAFVLHGAYYDLNYTTGIGGASRYSFNIRAIDASGNYRNTFWNKTGSLGLEIRRYVRLGCTQTNISYTPVYMYSTTYPMGDYGSIDRLNKDHGTKCPPGPMGGINDLGYMKKLAPTATVQRINNSQYIVFWYGEDSSNFLMNNYNLYYHVWWNVALPGTSATAYFGNTTSFAPNYVASFNHSTISKTESIVKSSIYYTFGGSNTSFYLGTGKKNVSAIKAYTDNNIYELFFGLTGNTKLISNVSFPSYLIWNVPGNATLNTSYPDSDLDGLSDWTELYHSYTSPFLADTDADGQTDSYEHLMGSDPNNYRSWYTASAPPAGFGNPYGFHANWTSSSSLNLSWTKGNLAISTKIVRKLGSYPLSPLDGSTIYNGVGTFVNDTGISPSDRWFYRGYSFNVSDSAGVNVAMTETDNTSVTTSSSATFKGYMTTDKNMWTNFHYSSSQNFGTTSINVTQLTEYYNGSAPYSFSGGYYLPNWFGQTFRTGDTGVYLYNVSFYAYRAGGLTMATVRLYDANITGLPSGAVLATGTKDVSGLTEWIPDWFTTEMPAYYLKSRTTYGIICSVSGGPANLLCFYGDNSIPMYSEGALTTYHEGGTGFANNTALDALFRINGRTPHTYPAGGLITSNITTMITGPYQIQKNDLVSGQIYYYYGAGNDSAGNMTKGNLRYTLTNPGVPVFLNLIPSFTNSSVKITWIKGVGANRTVVSRSNVAYPALVVDGVTAYNDTGSLCWVHNISFNTTYYFSLFAHTSWASLSRYSSGVHIPWGGVTFIVRNESKPWQIINATILVTDSEGLYPIQFDDVSGYYSFNISQIPYGENTIFLVSNTSYHSRTYVYDIIPNIFYNFSFYIPPIVSPPSGPPGNNTPNSYMIQIITTLSGESYEQQLTVDGSLVRFYRYLNTTADYTYIGGFITDGNGQGSIDLFPFQLYMIKISKDGYDNKTDFWTPNLVEQGLIKVFKIVASSVTPPITEYTDFWTTIIFTATMDDTNTTHVHYYDVSNHTIDTQLYLYEFYNGTTTFIGSDTKIGNNSFYWNISLLNYSRTYIVVLRFNSTNDFQIPDNRVVLTIYPLYPLGGFDLEKRITDVFGDFKINGIVYSWVGFFLSIIPLVVLTLFDPAHVGIGIISTGFFMAGVQGVIAMKMGLTVVPPLLIVVIPVIIVIGVLYMLAQRNGWL